MKYRVAELYPLTALATSANTLSIPLNLSDPISALFFEYKVTRASGTMVAHTAANLKTISLVDGSRVIFSMTGREAHAMAYWDQVIAPYSNLSAISTVMSILGIPYHFGRKLFDADLAFDPKKFKNPTLQISYDPTLHDASATVHYLGVQALCFDEKSVSPMGFLMSKTLANPTWVASASFAPDVLLPTDFPIRKLLMRGYYAAYFPHQVINHFKITEDNDKKVPFDVDLATFQKLMLSSYPRFVEQLQGDNASGGLTVYTAAAFDINVAGLNTVADKAPSIANVSQSVPLTLTEATASQIDALVSGHLPHHTVAVPFGDQDDPTDWYDVTSIGKLILRMKGGAAGSSSTVSVVTQQLCKY